MKIKVAILDDDQIYLRRIVGYFTSILADKVEIYSFSDLETALTTINEGPKKMDVFLASPGFDVDISKLPKNLGFAYFVDSPDIDNYREQPAICKFQKAELIYRQMLSIYADATDVIISHNSNDENDAIILSFVSACGGDGSSSVAAACAVNLANAGKKVLYLNLEQFGSSNVFFEAGGNFDLGDIIFAIKSNKSNITVKLESAVKHDISGVFYFESCKMAFDVMEINPNDMQRLLYELNSLGKYDYIIIDMDFNFNDREVEVMKESYRIIFVCSGSEISNMKMNKALNAITIFEQQNKIALVPKINIIYNKFEPNKCTMMQEQDVEMIGGINMFADNEPKQIVRDIAANRIFEKFMVK